IDPTQQTAEVLGHADKPLPTCKGVVLFADASDRSVCFLIAANIRRTARCRLFPPEAATLSKRADISPLVRRIYYQCCYNDFASTLRYYRICRLLYPDSWHKLITFPKLRFVRIDLSAQWPNFSAAEKPLIGDCQKTFGPFGTRKSANAYITALQTAFGLCRRPDLIDSPAKAATCPYLQMHTCPAPCVGDISRQDYFSQIDKAVSAAGGQIAQYAARIRDEMMQHAAQKQFEAAAALKKRLAALDLLKRGEYRWTRDISKLAILHIDRWARISPPGKKRKKQSYAAYLIKDGQILDCGAFLLDDLADVYRTLHDHLERPTAQIDPEKLTETLAIAASFIYRSSPPGIWIDCSADETPAPLPPQQHILDAIAKRFPPSPRAKKQQPKKDVDT
ncbi:MAG: hypothetical protein J7M40_03920, partial [Planctomycetes bacterium]|nr:hypothetical protein [Planctomycetota bacterium]